MLNATNPDLDAFKARDPQAGNYMRTFLLPGVLHCGGGAGPDTVDWVAAISDWVERGVAPSRLTARTITSGAVTRSRPICPYPQKAVYSGSGSTDDEKNFVCK